MEEIIHILYPSHLPHLEGRARDDLHSTSGGLSPASAGSYRRDHSYSTSRRDVTQSPNLFESPYSYPITPLSEPTPLSQAISPSIRERRSNRPPASHRTHGRYSNKESVTSYAMSHRLHKSNTTEDTRSSSYQRLNRPHQSNYNDQRPPYVVQTSTPLPEAALRYKAISMSSISTRDKKYFLTIWNNSTNIQTTIPIGADQLLESLIKNKNTKKTLQELLPGSGPSAWLSLSKALQEIGLLHEVGIFEEKELGYNVIKYQLR